MNPHRPKLVIVSNGGSHKDFSTFIDSTDWVIRFNNCEKIGTKRFGNRTDTLTLGQNRGSLSNTTAIPQRVRSTLRELWQVADSRTATPVVPASLQDLLPRVSLRHLFIDEMPHLHRILSSGENNDQPTPEFIVIETVLRLERFTRWEKYLVGINPQRHSRAEITRCQDHVSKGRLILL